MNWHLSHLVFAVFVCVGFFGLFCFGGFVFGWCLVFILFGGDFITAFWPATVHFWWPLNLRTAMCMHQLTLHPNLKHAIERVERPGGSHEGVGRKKNSVLRVHIFPTSCFPSFSLCFLRCLPFVHCLGFLFSPSFWFVRVCVTSCIAPPLSVAFSLSLFPDFFCPSPSGLRFWVLLADQQGIKPPPAVCLRLLCRDTCATRATFFSLFPERCIVSACCGHQLPLVHSRHNDSKNFSVVDWFCCLLREECDLCEAFEPFWVWAFPEAASVRYGRIRKLHRRKGCEMSEDICVGTPLWLRLWSEWYHLTWILWKCWSFWCGDGYNCFHWAICCRMMHSNLNSVLEAVVLVEASGHAAYRYVIWRLHFRDVRCCHLHFYIYHLQTISELGELVWNRFENAWCFEGFRTVSARVLRRTM